MVGLGQVEETSFGCQLSLEVWRGKDGGGEDGECAYSG